MKSLRFLLALTLSLVLACAPLFLGAQASLVYAEEGHEPHSVISAQLQKALEESSDSDYLEVLVRLKETSDDVSLKQEFASSGLLDQSMASGMTRPEAERGALVAEWEELAQKTQQRIRALADTGKQAGEVQEYKSFYIINALKLKAQPSFIYKLAQLPEVKSIEPNFKIKPIDPIKKKKRSRRSLPAEVDGIEWGIKFISAQRVWEELGITGRGVRVGIIDGGTNYNHPALLKKFAGYVADGEVYPRGSYFDAVEEGQETPRSDSSYDHGTHVAGIILGSDGDMNRIGVAPGAEFIAARAIGEQEGATDDLLEAAEWMLKPGGSTRNAPRIINNSWGGDADANEWFKDIADKWRAANILPVFASGNTTGKPALDGSIANPGNLFNVFTSGAVDASGRLADFSKVGPSAFGSEKIKPDVVAPGVEIRSALASGGYAALSGTSMAAPHVAGTAALMIEANPQLTVDQIEAILKETATPSDASRFGPTPNMGMGYGIINAYDAVRKALALKSGDSSDQRISISGHVYKRGADNEAAKISSLSENAAYQGRSITFRAQASDDVSVVGVRAYFVPENSEQFSYEAGAPLSEEIKAHAHQLDLSLVKGSAQDGVWQAELSAEDSKGVRGYNLWFEATDFSSQQSSSANQHISVKKGIVPDAYTNDFETQIDGWKFTGQLAAEKVDSDWSWGSPSASAEPKAVSGSKLIGTKLGSNAVSKFIDSYAYMPPLDLSDPQLKQAHLSFDEYVGVNGVTECKIQLARSEQGPWEDLDEKLIPPGTQAQWTRVSYSLAPYLHSPDPVHLRFVFHFPDHGEGVGWYIDNVSLSSKDTQAPSKVLGLSGFARAQNAGVQLYWNKVSDNDVVSYELYRYPRLYQAGVSLETMGSPEHIASIQKDAPVMGYFDSSPSNVSTYIVRAKDAFGNESAVGECISVDMSSLAPAQLHYDFNENDASFTPQLIEGENNDWEYGVPRAVGNKDSIFVLREIMIGLGDKIKRADKLWGTNLGKPDLSLGDGIYNARISRKQHAALLTPPFTLDKASVVQFESFNALHYLSDYQENFEQLELSEDGGKTWIVLLSPAEIMNVDDKFKFVWKTADLSPYLHKELRLRFVIQTTERQVLNDYDIGWYIDNVMIGPKPLELQAQKCRELPAHIELSSAAHSAAYTSAQTDPAASSPVASKPPASAAAVTGAGSTVPQGVVPLKGAHVELTELSKEMTVHPATGGYSFLASTGAWNLTARAYGYKSQSIQVPNKKEAFSHDFILEPLQQASIQGVVRDESGAAVADAFVRVMSDSEIPVVKTDRAGVYRIEGVYAGTHTVRAYKSGFTSATKQVELTETGLDQFDFTLNSEQRESSELSFDNGTAKTNIVFYQANRGAAVRFYPAKKSGILTGARAYFKAMEQVSDRRVKIAVMQDDENQRLVRRAEFVHEVVPDSWNEFDLRSYNIATDKPFYVVVLQMGKQGSSYGVAFDTQGINDEATKHSYLYNGSFVPALSQSVVGACMIRASMEYPLDAQANDPDPLLAGPGSVQPSKPENSADDFEWEETPQGAVVKKYLGSSKEVKVPASHEGKPVVAIGDNAFAWKYLKSLSLPEGIVSIGKGAFSAGFSASEEVELTLPDSVTSIGAGAFSGSGLKSLTAKSVRSLHEADIFSRNNGLEIRMPQLEEFDPAVFGTAKPSGFAYNRLYVDKPGTSMQDIDGLVLINPARVDAEVWLRETESLDMKLSIYGPTGAGSYDNSYAPSDFYKIGQEIELPAPRNLVVSYYESSKKLSLTQPLTTVRFEADRLKANVKPIYPGETPVLEGKTLAGAVITLPQELDEQGRPREFTADKDGLFRLELSAKTLSDRVEMIVTDAAGKSIRETIKLTDPQDRIFIIEPNTSGRLLDYLGSALELSLPASIQDERGNDRILRILGTASLKNKGIVQLTGFERLERLRSIETAALYGNKLRELQFPNNVREVGRSAFAYNKLTRIKLPKLLHKIGDYAFEHNQLESLELGEYTGHFGAYSFAYNLLRELSLPARIEELDEGAFMNNRLENLVFETLSTGVVGAQTQGLASAGHGHVLESLPERVFAGNSLVELRLPETISAVADSAFAQNGVLVNLLSNNTQLHDAILSENSGHIINGASILVRFVDKQGNEIAPAQTWVAQGKERRIGLDTEWYRLGVSARLTAPEISGYKLLSVPVDFVPVAGESNSVDFVYEAVETSTGGADPDGGKIAPVDTGSGETADTGSGETVGADDFQPKDPAPGSSKTLHSSETALAGADLSYDETLQQLFSKQASRSIPKTADFSRQRQLQIAALFMLALGSCAFAWRLARKA